MFNSLFHLEISIWEKIARAALVYLILLFALRLAGKRELSQLNVTDFVLLLILSNAVQNGIIGQDSTISGAFIGVGTLITINYGASLAIQRNSYIRRILVGTSSVIIKDGQLDIRALRRERMSHEDIEMAIAEVGARSISDVERCLLEPDGRLAITLKDEQLPLRKLQAISLQLDELKIAISNLHR
ncbi:unannotated protein [freshwater metagenome]|uniref:Unannotated protein n=1 Tax=freshwater metagenome TaxID=449393 RepID=A0A6J6CT38_9ZZZZ|nr:DUF421 domain-containing protein [Actinomycetota bacterium]MTA93034.1 DUF421 domain-containing protein [Actinomycetota bacterium]